MTTKKTPPVYSYASMVGTVVNNNPGHSKDEYWDILTGIFSVSGDAIDYDMAKQALDDFFAFGDAIDYDMAKQALDGFSPFG